MFRFLAPGRPTGHVWPAQNYDHVVSGLTIHLRILKKSALWLSVRSRVL